MVLVLQLMRMRLNLYCKWQVLTGVPFIIFIKLYLRPLFRSYEVFGFMLGVAPNLIGAYLLIFSSYLVLKKRQFLFDKNVLRYQCFLFFTLLTCNEYLQKFPVFRRTFDYWDILFSVVGIAIGYFVFNKLHAMEQRMVIKQSIIIASHQE